MNEDYDYDYEIDACCDGAMGQWGVINNECDCPDCRCSYCLGICDCCLDGEE